MNMDPENKKKKIGKGSWTFTVESLEKCNWGEKKRQKKKEQKLKMAWTAVVINMILCSFLSVEKSSPMLFQAG